MRNFERVIDPDGLVHLRWPWSAGVWTRCEAAAGHGSWASGDLSAAKDDVLVTCIPCYAAYTNLTECRP